VAHDDVARYHALIDVFVVPRTEDRVSLLVTPLKPFEAMALRRPLVVANLPALAELAKPGERGLAFTAGDPAALADAVGTLLDHPDQAGRFADEGRRWVLAERTWAANGQRYQDIYRELLDRWRAGQPPAGHPRDTA
jgi:glycosyltransferase involved in cell wall biosynthesis